ncbi:MAG TPA: hypothetical protein VGT08_01200, partial [Terracidiphilus sp.]|nr:hypothetical protein [Terracidiphilus sp.]
EQKRRSDNRGLHGPYGAEWLLLTAFPTLKRGAKDRCASGAKEIRIGLVEKSVRLAKWIHAIALSPSLTDSTQKFRNRHSCIERCFAV